ncbi:MAG: hypothetical protein FD143_794 [Ignavibacteria bacterium]|nr:MAG: hypothetical protein FD143_794 [Ignavibacteria bacterium]KAF0160619.1 MAG: hypothetical protein FD188_1611 [Ignavibacteria bacterium]
MPLTNSLGYEFVVVNSILLFFQIGFYTSRKLKSDPHAKFFSFIKSNYLELIAYLLIPIVIGTLSSLLNSHCPVKDGFAFCAAIFLPSFLLGIVLAFYSSSITLKYNRFVFSFIAVLLLLTSLLEFYLLPQIYFYNPIFGFFPGTIYDEDIAVNLKLILFQLFNFSLFGFGFFLTLKMKNKYKAVRTFVLMLLLVSFYVFLKPLLGFSTNKSKLETELSNKIITEHFEVFLGDSVKKPEYEFIALQHEYYYERVIEQLQLNETPIITSYFFDDKNQKRELFGAGSADVAKPWMNMIFLNYSNYKSSLKHEIVHSAAAKFGVTPFKAADNINSALIEGLAMFIENDFAGFPVIYGAKLAFNNNYKVNMNDVFNTGKFFTSYSSLSYIYSGAFLEFLSNRFGVEKVKELYTNLDFEEVIGEKFDTLSLQFELYLTDSAFNGKQNEAQLYFGGQTIFKKFCPRMASNDIKKAQAEFSKQNYNFAAEQYLAVYKYASSAGALSGYIASLKKEKKYELAVSVLEKEIKHFSKSHSLYNLELQLADCYLLSGDTTKANFYYDLILTQNPHQNFVNWLNVLRLIWNYNGVEFVKEFLTEDETERRNTLFNLYEKTKNILLLPYLLDTEEENLPQIIGAINKLKKELSISDYASRKAAVDISQFLLMKKDYASAKFFAVKAVENFTDDFKKHRLVENLRMVNWFVNFANETKLRVEHIK